MASWLIEYLLDNGFLGRADLVDSPVEIEEVSSRLASFTVRRANVDSGLFVKVAVDDEQLSSLANEAAACAYIRAHGTEGLQQRVPRVLLSDMARGVLITKYAENEGPLHQHVMHSAGESVEIGTALGEALAALHRMPLSTQEFRCSPPWILTVTEPSVDTYWEMSLATREFIARLQREPLLMRELSTMKNALRSDALTHGDLKSENVLICRADAGVGVAIVDWELLGVGDPLWDVGSVLHDGLRSWVESVPFAEGTGTALMRLAEYPLEGSFPLVRSFWETYTNLMCWDRSTSASALDTAVKSAAARLIQSAYESMQMEAELTVHGAAQLQLCVNILKSPQVARSHLFGVG